jgi:hypothetical protein
MFRHNLKKRNSQHNDTQHNSTYTVDAVMLSDVYAECRKFAHNAECRGAQ